MDIYSLRRGSLNSVNSYVNHEYPLIEIFTEIANKITQYLRRKVQHLISGLRYLVGSPTIFLSENPTDHHRTTTPHRDLARCTVKT